MKRARTGSYLLIATLAATTSLTGTLQAQEGTGVRASLGVTQGLEWSDNRRLDADSPGSTFTSVTALNFGALSETRTERLSFNLDGRYEASFGDGATDADEFRLVSNGARLDYRRTGADSRFRFGASMSEREITDEVFGFFVDGEFDPNALIVDGGTVERSNIFAGLDTGIESPFGLSLSARRSETDYVDVSDPELLDKTTIRVDATARFRIRPSLALRALGGLRETDETDGSNVETTSRTYVGFGLEAASARGLSFTGDLIFDQSETDLNGTRTDDDDGVGFEVEVTQERPDGEFGVELTSRIDSSGRRTTASVSRALELPTGGLRFSLGLVDQDDEDVALTSSLDYVRETPVGRVSAILTQRPSTDAGEAFLNTSFNLGLEREINSVSAWGASVEYGSARAFSEDNADRRASIGLTYERDLTREWGLTAGLEHTRIDDADDANRSSNTVFINIGRDFDFGF